MENPPEGVPEHSSTTVNNETMEPVAPKAPTRKPSFRKSSNRARLSKASSPLGLMAEMRRAGLRGRKHLSPEIKSGSAVLAAKKIALKLSGQGVARLSPIPENKPLRVRLTFEESESEGAVPRQESKEAHKKGSDDPSEAEATINTGDGQEAATPEVTMAESTVALITVDDKDGDLCQDMVIASQVESLDDSGQRDLKGKQTICHSQLPITIFTNEESEVTDGGKDNIRYDSEGDQLVSTDVDFALDLGTAQPLMIGLHDTSRQTIDNVGVSTGIPIMGLNSPTKANTPEQPSQWARLEERNMVISNVDQDTMDEEFPPLNKERLKKIKEKFEKPNKVIPSENSKNGGKLGEHRGTTGRPEGKLKAVMDNSIPTIMHAPGQGTQNEKVEKEKTQRRSLVEIIRENQTSPITFEPEKIRKIGIIGESAGLPSIYFSGSDTTFLAEKLGHAVVGKFSHSIPSSNHIQKALTNMKFVGEFNWKYINAKHILVQFKTLSDYAKLLSGPNGMPVWFIDRHPMRVFKWTPEFDPFFESPITAVWCNLVGLPIHLFEKSALFAIGSLLGEPIQVDHATVSQTRLSFARLCIEIDISSTPPEEIILDLQGREVRQKVKWDRIPLYCRECKHVGHSWESCYASGRREKPKKKDYTNHQNKHQYGGPTGNGDNRWKEATYRGESSAQKKDHLVANGSSEEDKNQTTDSVQETMQRPVNVEESYSDQDAGEFRTQGRRRGRSKKGGNQVVQKQRSSSNEPQDIGRFGDYHGNESLAPNGWGQKPSPPAHEQRQKELEAFKQDHIVKPRFYCLTEDGEFDTENYEDEVDMDLENEEEVDEDQSRPPDKHGHETVDSEVKEDDGNHKKVKLSASTSNRSG